MNITESHLFILTILGEEDYRILYVNDNIISLIPHRFIYTGLFRRNISKIDFYFLKENELIKNDAFNDNCYDISFKGCQIIKSNSFKLNVNIKLK